MDKLYTSINSSLPPTDDNSAYATPVLNEEGAHAVPQRIYTSIVPEKPAVLAEERIFVYVPKVTFNSAGIAKFVPEQFNILNGEVSLNQNYFVEIIAEAAAEVLTKHRGVFFPEDLPPEEERYINLVLFDNT